MKTAKKTTPKLDKKPKIRVVRPEDIASEKINVKVERPTKEKAEADPSFGKFEVLTVIPLKEGFVRAQVLQDYKGMEDDLYCGDIIDLPERRFKSLSFRGMVKEYKGGLNPNKRR
jgi:hypothetical protein